MRVSCLLPASFSISVTKIQSGAAANARSVKYYPNFAVIILNALILRQQSRGLCGSVWTLWRFPCSTFWYLYYSATRLLAKTKQENIFDPLCSFTCFLKALWLNTSRFSQVFSFFPASWNASWSLSLLSGLVLDQPRRPSLLGLRKTPWLAHTEFACTMTSQPPKPAVWLPSEWGMAGRAVARWVRRREGSWETERLSDAAQCLQALSLSLSLSFRVPLQAVLY